MSDSRKIIKILCTIGPATLKEEFLKKFEKEHVSLLRINLSHTKTEELENVIQYIQKHTVIPICIDSEGAQLRTGYLTPSVLHLIAGSTVKIRVNPEDCRENEIYLNHPFILKHIRIGEIIFVDFDSVILQVIDKLKNGDLLCKIITGGKIGSNKAVNLENRVELPALTEKDIKAIEISKKYGITHYALSFAQSASDVKLIRGMICEKTFLISKIESTRGIENLEDIIHYSDAILIDRGDLSREQQISKIPYWQKIIAKKVKLLGKELYVATNLLESMIEKPTPTRAEINDVANTLLDGADGLVLAAETAIGNHPVTSVRVLRNAIKEYCNFIDGTGPSLYHSHSNLIKPHGGKLILVPKVKRSEYEQKQHARINIPLNEKQYLDFIQLAFGGYSPVSSFMTKEEIESVLNTSRLPNTIIWPIPIILQVNENLYNKIGINDRLALCKDETAIGFLNVSQKFKLDIDNYCQLLFQTTSSSHPGVQGIRNGGQFAVAGSIEIIEDITINPAIYELTPSHSRTIFENKGWMRVVGFHTRNIPHNGHIYIQKKTYHSCHADGLFIHPVAGPRKKGDFSIQQIISCYEQLLSSEVYQNYNVVLGAFSYYSRFAGPREAILTALCRQNYGCSHFIIGRDHAGVSNFYKNENSGKYIDGMKDKIDIELVICNEVSYCLQCNLLTDGCEHASAHKKNISGTYIRDCIAQNKPLDELFIHKKIAGYLRAQNKEEIFI